LHLKSKIWRCQRLKKSKIWRSQSLKKSKFEEVEDWSSKTQCGDPRDLSYTKMLCVLVTLATSDTGVTSPRPEHHRQAGRN
jgi:hypothetical protein